MCFKLGDCKNSTVFCIISFSWAVCYSRKRRQVQLLLYSLSMLSASLTHFMARSLSCREQTHDLQMNGKLHLKGLSRPFIARNRFTFRIVWVALDRVFPQVEKELYSKFKLVLNEKKNKIRRLMEGIVSSTAATAIDDDEDEYASPDEDEATSLSTPPPPSAQSSKEHYWKHCLLLSCWSKALLGELDEISPPTKRRKRETRCRGTKEPDIPKRPTIPCPQTKTVKEPQLNSSADGDELLGLL